MSSVPAYGADESVETSVQVPAPAGERWKVTVLTAARSGVGGGRRERDGCAAQVRCRGGGGQRAARADAVDRDQDELRRLLAGVVGRAHAQQARPVGRDRPRGLVGRARVDAQQHPRVGDAGRGVLGALVEADVGDAAAGVLGRRRDGRRVGGREVDRVRRDDRERRVGVVDRDGDRGRREARCRRCPWSRRGGRSHRRPGRSCPSSPPGSSRCRRPPASAGRRPLRRRSRRRRSRSRARPCRRRPRRSPAR